MRLAEMIQTIETVRQYWDRQPCNSTDFTPDKYQLEPHIPGFAQFNRWTGKKVLEIGVGIGYDASNFARAGAYYTGVDLSEKSLELCRKRFEVYGLGGRFYHGNAETLSSFLPVESYDLIYSFGVIHHTPHPEKVFEEIKKYCSPDTEIRIMLYARWSWKVLRIILVQGRGAFWKRDELVRNYSEAQANCPVVNIYSFGEIRRLLRDLEIIEMKKDYLSLWGREKGLIERLPRFFRQWLARWLGWNILIVARLK
ncbi:MAG: class I SAM-dependent methyltransferase [Candidatus Vogelbacteria bacterium]|nr:class I SAM-dependent methyltransferase [Candidatus Vogelbacteria bacterium]